MDRRIRHALRGALGIGTGIMLGGALLPRLAAPQLYNDTWPPLALHCALYFLVAGLVALAIFFLSGRKRK